MVLSTSAILMPVIRIHFQYLTKSYLSGKLQEKDWLDSRKGTRERAVALVHRPRGRFMGLPDGGACNVKRNLNLLAFQNRQTALSLT
jgi:hypothetical protein